MSGESIVSVLKNLWMRYHEDTSQRLKLIDAYLAYVMLTGIIQFVYCCLVGTFPFNSFLSGFISTVGCFVLGGWYYHGNIYTYTLCYVVFCSVPADPD